MRRKMGGEVLEVIQFQELGYGFTWANIINFDILFLQRPSMDAEKRMKLVQYCRDMGIKIWTDFDDNLFDLPTDNRVCDDVTIEVKRAMIHIMLKSDVVTVSTEALKIYFESLDIANIEVIPNAVNLDLLTFAESYNEPLTTEGVTVLHYVWRGSETHQGDLAAYQGQIFVAIQKHEGVHWNFLGYNPWFITQALPKELFTYARGEDILVYFKSLRALRPQVVHFPLIFNAINAGKSNIAWMEATCAGAVCIAPDWPEWRKPGVINYTSAEHYGQLLSEPIPDAAARWKESRDYIMENLTLDKVNQKRMDLIERLLSRKVRLPIPQTMIE
jgi:hypothetical protein